MAFQKLSELLCTPLGWRSGVIPSMIWISFYPRIESSSSAGYLRCDSCRLGYWRCWSRTSWRSGGGISLSAGSLGRIGGNDSLRLLVQSGSLSLGQPVRKSIFFASSNPRLGRAQWASCTWSADLYDLLHSVSYQRMSAASRSRRSPYCYTCFRAWGWRMCWKWRNFLHLSWLILTSLRRCTSWWFAPHFSFAHSNLLRGMIWGRFCSLSSLSTEPHVHGR